MGGDGGEMDTYWVPPTDVFLALSHLILTQPCEARVIILICRSGIGGLTRLSNLLTANEREPRFKVRLPEYFLLQHASCSSWRLKKKKNVGLFETQFKNILLPEIIS